MSQDLLSVSHCLSVWVAVDPGASEQTWSMCSRACSPAVTVDGYGLLHVIKQL